MATHTATVTTKASAEKVFDALTQPEFVKKWQYGRVVTTDWKEGNEIRFRTEVEGYVTEQWGTVLAVRKNELIRYSLFTPRTDMEDKPENYNVTSYVLTTVGGQTKIELIQEDNRPSGFTPQTLKGILVALRNVAESN